MSRLLRLPLVLLVALGLLFLWSGSGTAEETPTAASSTGETGGSTAAETGENTAAETGENTAGGTDESIADSLAGVNVTTSATTSESSSSAAALTTTAAPTGGSLARNQSVAGADESTSSTTSSSTTTSTAPNPGTCIADVVEKLATDLQAALGDNGEELAAEIQAALSDPTKLPAFLEDLPAFLQDAGEELAAQGAVLLDQAGKDLQKCLPSPPTAGGSTSTSPTRSSSNNNQGGSQGQPFTYSNCDEARAHGAAPVYAGQYGYGAHLDSDNDGIGCEDATQYAAATNPQPTGKLAYTGVDLEPMLRLCAILISSGTLLLLAGQRRA